MAIGKRSLMNEHMIVVLNKVKENPEPMQKSYLYCSQAEKEEVDYMISTDLLKEVTYIDTNGASKKGCTIGDFGETYLKTINELQMNIHCQEQSALGKDIDDDMKAQSYEESMSSKIEELTNRGKKKIEDIRDWKDNKKAGLN